MNNVTRNDPRHYTERALRLSACWQVWTQQMFRMRNLANESLFRGDHPHEDLSRFGLELQKEQLKETFARMMLQNAIDWACSGVDQTGNHHQHAANIWGEDITSKLGTWWSELFTRVHESVIKNHEEGLEASKKWDAAQNPALTEETDGNAR